MSLEQLPAGPLPVGTNFIGQVQISELLTPSVGTGSLGALNDEYTLGNNGGRQTNAIQLDFSGGASLTVTFEGQVEDTGAWTPMQTVRLADETLQTTATADGFFLLPSFGFYNLRIRVSTYVSGSVTVYQCQTFDPTIIRLGAPLPPVTNAGTFAVQAASAGDVAHDGVDSGNPVKVGGKAVNAEPAAVANADRANFITDLVGKLITLPYANPENFVSGAITTAMTGTTSTSLIAAPASGLRNYITQITVSNAHATVGTDVIIQDGSGGTTLYTIPAAAVYGGAAISFPVPLRQPTTATALYCANVTTGASTKVSASGYKGQ